MVRAGMQVRVRIADGLRPGVAVFEGKWWGAPAETAAEMNHLTASRWSPGGQPAYNECYVTVRPVDAITCSTSSATVAPASAVTPAGS